MSDKHLSDVGDAPASEPVHLFITLAHRNQAQLDALIRNQETPGSKDYLHFLTPSQFDAQFGALPGVRGRIKAALSAAGFKPARDRFGASVIEADGDVAAAEALFQVKIHDVRDQDGRPAHIPVAAPVTPAFLETGAVSILGLDTTRLVNEPFAPAGGLAPQYVCDVTCGTPIPRGTPYPRPSLPPPSPTPVPGSQYPSVGPSQPLTAPVAGTDDTYYDSNFGYAPYTYAYDYDMPVQHGFAGSSQFPVGIIGVADVSNSDLSKFYSDMHINRTGSFTRYGVPQSSPSRADQFEATLDVETVTALAPNAPVIFYLSTSAQPADMTGDINTVVQQNAVSVLSISYVFCENQGYFGGSYESASGVDSAAAQASAQGITVVASSGDAGAHPSGNGWVDCGSVYAPAASSYVVGVGGTSPFAPNNNEGTPGTDGYRAGYEYAWGQSAPSTASPPCSLNFCGTTGGASTHFQTAENLGACGGSGTTWRCVPDIALAADFYHKGAMTWQGVTYAAANGTSFAAPIFAAMQAEIDQRQSTRKGNVVGSLYSIWSRYGYGPISSGQNPVFRDITQGNTGYQAVTGWDATSGLGSVNGFALSSVE